MLLIFSNNGVYRSQHVLARHCVEKAHEVVIPFDIVFFTGPCQEFVEGFPQLWHALHTWTVGVPCLDNHGQSNGCHLQQLAAQGLCIRDYSPSFGELLFAFQKNCAPWQRSRFAKTPGIPSGEMCRDSVQPSDILKRMAVYRRQKTQKDRVRGTFVDAELSLRYWASRDNLFQFALVPLQSYENYQLAWVTEHELIAQ